MEFSVRPAGPQDLPALHEVIETTGWGIAPESVRAIQTWEPEAYLVAEDQSGRALGVIFGLRWSRTGWLGHLVVRPESRGGGVGKALFGRALARLEAAGCRTVYLTATTMGEPLYTRFGFVADGGWSRWRGTASRDAAACFWDGETSVDILTGDDLGEVAAFDAARFGDDRGKALRYLYDAYPGGGRVARRRDGSVAGYLLTGTEGLGPFVAEEDAARPLFGAALELFRGRTLSFTFPDANRLARELCREAGLEPFRSWLRMRLGPDPAPPRDGCIFNASVAKG